MWVLLAANETRCPGILCPCRGEFWVGNDHIHLLTKAKDMVLRIELEDFEGVREYAKYDQFYVANEFLRYRLSVSGYRYSVRFKGESQMNDSCQLN